MNKKMVHSAAESVLIKRAVSCSFSSVFHLSKAGMLPTQFLFVKRTFLGAIVVPVGIMVTLAGLYKLRSEHQQANKL